MARLRDQIASLNRQRALPPAVAPPAVRKADHPDVARQATVDRHKAEAQIAEIKAETLQIRAETTRMLMDTITSIVRKNFARAVTFDGPHDPTKTYRANAMVQRSGSTWIALGETSEAPGASAMWRRIGTDR